MKWFITDAGRNKSKRSKQQNDCTVRAFALANNIAYDDAYDILAKDGRKSSRGHDFNAFAKKQTNMLYVSFPAAKGRPRMNIESFCDTYTKGTYIIKTAKHVSVVRDGVVYDDSEPRPDRCVYGAWKVI